MRTAHVVIVGAGLSGLYAAFLLEQRGFHDYLLIEARDVPGGRIASFSVPGHASRATMADRLDLFDRFDLGPTWFWPDFQPELDRLVRDLGLQRFAQYEDGDMMLERSSNAPAVRTPGYASSPASMRLVGGMGALIDTLRRRMDVTRIVTGETVRRLRAADRQVELDSLGSGGRTATYRAGRVLLAMPPRLAEERIEFSPALPGALARQWRATPTWMAPHAKYVALYETPFWREQGLSGEARSGHGPMGEIHDASMPGGSAALFGFLTVPGRIRGHVPEDVLRSHCRAQLVRLFGRRAATPVADTVKDWAQDPYTATAADLDGTAPHVAAPAAMAASAPWNGRLVGIASEWSPQFPGYLAGSIEAARLGVQALLSLDAELAERTTGFDPSGPRA